MEPYLAGIGKYDLMAYGSHYLGMPQRKSDIDILILTDRVLSQKSKKSIHQRLSKINIDPIILSKSSYRKMNSIHFILAAPIECISRYGEMIKGNEKLKSKMNDTDFQTGMLFRALFSLSKWETIEDEEKTTKQLARISMILWNLEGKIPLDSILSFSHFCMYCYQTGAPALQQDSAWQYLEKSGQLYSWMDHALNTTLTPKELTNWANILKSKAKPFLNRMAFLHKNRPLSPELKDYQANHPLYRGLKWRKVGKNFVLDGENFQILLRIYAGLNKI